MFISLYYSNIININFNQIKNVYLQYDTQKSGKLSFENFVLAISNGLMKNSFEDPLMTETF